MNWNPRVGTRDWLPGASYVLAAILAVVAVIMLFDQLPATSSFLPGSFSRSIK